MTNQHASGLPPSIIVSSRDFARLEALLDSPALRHLPAAEALMAELNRADVREPEQVPADVVTMHSRVECVDELSGERHTLTLVYPNEADVTRGHVSILAPVGTALLGLSIGQSIRWQAPGGRELQLRVESIHGQADPAAGATR